MYLSELDELIKSDKLIKSIDHEFGFETGGLLWHYTNAEGVDGIIRNKSIRLSHPGFLNDPGELQYAEEIYKNTLSELSCDQDALGQKFINGYRVFETDFQRQYGEKTNPFVASFCKDRDNLDLWREYGDDGQGFALGFNMSELQNVLSTADTEMSRFVHVCRVLYDRNEQKKLTSMILESYLSQFRRIQTDSGDPDVELKVYIAAFHTTMDSFAPFLKHPCYENENEGRLVLYGESIASDKIQFSPRRGYFKPYIDLCIKTNRNHGFPLHTIVVGPATDPSRCERSLRLLMDSHGFNDIRILPSELPYRGRTSASNLR